MGSSSKRALLRIVYRLAVLAVALALVVGLIYRLEARDRSTFDDGSTRDSRAKTTMRVSAL